VEDHWDDRAFRERILDHLSQQAMEVLELGAGAGVVEQMDFREEAARVCGIDPDERVVRNPHLDEAKVGVGEAIPYPDASFDLVFACNVLEHLERPRAVFQEVRRVLRPGGVFLAKTPNRWHYVPLIASLTPRGFHEWVNRLRGREEGDTFPTLYRANTPRAVRRLGAATGFSVDTIELLEGRPEYLRITPPSYLVGWMYERAVNLVPPLSRFRVVLMVELRR